MRAQGRAQSHDPHRHLNLPLQAPPRKRKAVALEAPAIVAKKSSRRPNLEERAAAEVPRAPVSREEGAAAQPSTTIVTTKSSRRRHFPERAAAEVSVTARHDDGGAAQPSTPREAARVEPPPANDDRKSAIVTVKRKSRFGDAPESLTPEELQRRGDVPHLPMELLLSRKPVERDGDDYKRLKAAMARRLRGE